MRLTTDKPVLEMNMTELAYNSCYSNNGYATFRDYEKITDARHMIRNIFIKKNIAMPCAFWDNDDAFDEIMRDNLQYGLDNDIGIISLLYLQIWTKADMREVLKQYEDAEEQGLLLKLPCKIGDTVYCIRELCDLKGTKVVDEFTVCRFELRKLQQFVVDFYGHRLNIANFGKTIFITKSEAEKALANTTEN